MFGCFRDFLRTGLLLLSAVCILGCPSGLTPNHTTSTGGGGTSSSSSGTGGSDAGPCGGDCSKFQTPQCTVSVCNTGQVLGTLNACVEVPVADGTACDDGMFCTVSDVCMAGMCVGGAQNDCGMAPIPCEDIECFEDSQTCGITPVDDGTPCTPTDLCQVGGACALGACDGQPKDCSFSPLNECNVVACDSTTGMCTGTPDPTKDNIPCVLSGPLCNVDKTCMSGQCQGGMPMDCSALDSGCTVGACDDTTGLCGPANAPIGTACNESIPACHVGTCSVKGLCLPTTGPDGAACNDHNACTQNDTCAAGVCSGTPVAGCTLYFNETFPTCPDSWTLQDDWKCGVPVNVGPATCFGGGNCLGTNIGMDYDPNQTFAGCIANSPIVDLTNGTNPELSFWVWDYTEGGTFDGWNLKISVDGGQTYTEVPKQSVTPAYMLMIAGQAAWGGNFSAQGWQNYTADLTAYKGQKVNLQFGFRSDPATQYPGVYIDNVVVAEPVQIPLYISTPSPLPDAFAGTPYSAPILSTGGDSSAVWTITGGTNDAWLSIEPATGVLTGTPTQAEVGPVTVTVHLEEPGLPSNFADQTYTFNVDPDIYYTSFEGTCPDGWTLTGDWQCGVPMNPNVNTSSPPTAPATAFDGTQCIATGLIMDYSNNDTYADTTATSPLIDLSTALTPTLTFRMWVDTEGVIYDGFNLQISTNGGTSYSVVTPITPAYPLMIAGEPAWGGHQAALGWQPVQVDLTAYAGNFVLLQFAFRSDPSDTYAGVFIDSFLVSE